MLHSIVYVSSAVSLLSAADLVELLRVSRENNERLGVTGMLLYHDGNFIQALEGAPDAVRALSERIARDPRHAGMITLLRETLEAPRFPTWSMGFRDLTRVAPDEPGVTNLLAEGTSAAAFAANPHRAAKLLLAFRRNLLR